MLDKCYQAGADEAFDQIMSKLGSANSIDYLDELVEDSLATGMEKEAFFSAAAKGLMHLGKGLSMGGKALAQGRGASSAFRLMKRPMQQGWRGYKNTAGGRFLRNTANWAGMGGNRSMFVQAPLLFGGIGAATAEEGKGLEGFLKGSLGALGMGAGIKWGGKAVSGLLGAGGKAIGKTAPAQSAWKGLGSIGKANETGLTAVQRALKATGKGALPVAGMAGGFALTMGSHKLTDPIAEAIASQPSPRYAFSNTLQVPQGQGNNPFNPMY